MRAPFQILAIPYRVNEHEIFYCVLKRADCGNWQFIAGGGEDGETPLEAAKREALEESGVTSDKWIELKSLSYLPANVISEEHRRHWKKDIFVIPEYTFGFACESDITLSHEHGACVWLTYQEAGNILAWDSNRIALYELTCRLKAK